jgi:hypothetical protein
VDNVELSNLTALLAKISVALVAPTIPTCSGFNLIFRQAPNKSPGGPCQTLMISGSRIADDRSGWDHFTSGDIAGRECVRAPHFARSLCLGSIPHC